VPELYLKKDKKRLPEFHLWHWFAFGGLIAVLLALDLSLFHRRDHTPSWQESAALTLFWCILAAAFNGLIWRWRGGEAGLQFLTGYLVEWSLSMDNVFVFAVIFRYFQVPRQYQYPVLFWGILGAVFLRLAFVLAGTVLVRRLDWILPLFGVFLVYTAYRLTRHAAAEVDPQRNLLLRLARRWLPVTRDDHQQHGRRFFVREQGQWLVTPLLLVLLVIESTDVLFAVDSVPAIFGISKDPYIIFTSNIFAILGLRALYFLLSGALDWFRYLNYGLAAVLGFVGLKMIAQWWTAGETDRALIPAWVSLLVIVALLGISIVASVACQRQRPT